MNNLQRVVLVHYHEIGLKGHNRSKFEERLVRNLEALVSPFPVVAIHRISGRLVIFLKEGCAGDIALECAAFVRKVPGVARTSCGFKCAREMDEIGTAAIDALSEAVLAGAQTFKVSARRNHTDFPIDSMQINRDIGSVCCEAFPALGVRMKGADVEVGVEVIQNAAFVYAVSERGIGGLPVGSSGRVCCLLSSGIDSPVATWRMARRGANCIGVHFSGRPQTSDESEALVDDIAHILAKTGCISKVYYTPIGDYQREISVAAPPALRVILYRRLMFMVAERIARKEHAGALVTGESLGQVASQTLDNMAATSDSVSMQILRPLVGLDKLEIIEQAQELGTFDISTQDAPDCCTLFMPRSPETHARIDAVREAESAYPASDWADEIAGTAEKINY